MNTGTFPVATLGYIESGVPRNRILKLVSMKIISSNFLEFTFYMSGVEHPLNRRTLIIPASAFLYFEADGYAN